MAGDDQVGLTDLVKKTELVQEDLMASHSKDSVALELIRLILTR